MTSLLAYYRGHHFNPVLISVEDREVWLDHFAKRRNLYMHHLGIPTRLLRQARVLELGCNSGENALVLAAAGAELTLVEPNEQVVPRLRRLFDAFGLSPRIRALHVQGMESFATEDEFDLVIAEGFLFTLPDRESLLRRLCGWIAPEGLGIVSFNDRCGSLLELTRSLLVHRACELSGADPQGQDSLALARRLHEEDFRRLPTSRPFEAWWRDMLVNPLFSARHLWSHAEVLAVVAASGCQVHGTSPRWAHVDDCTWYKRVPTPEERHREFVMDWRRALRYFLTGVPQDGRGEPAPAGVVDALVELAQRISDYIAGASPIDAVRYPPAVSAYLDAADEPEIRSCSAALWAAYEALGAGSADELIGRYRGAGALGPHWGVPYHYLCFHRMG